MKNLYRLGRNGAGSKQYRDSGLTCNSIPEPIWCGIGAVYERHELSGLSGQVNRPGLTYIECPALVSGMSDNGPSLVLVKPGLSVANAGVSGRDSLYPTLSRP